jgi:hypothetical protein
MRSNPGGQPPPRFSFCSIEEALRRNQLQFSRHVAGPFTNGVDVKCHSRLSGEPFLVANTNLPETIRTLRRAFVV